MPLGANMHYVAPHSDIRKIPLSEYKKNTIRDVSSYRLQDLASLSQR